MNVLQSLLQAVQKPPTPPHVGEVMLLWTYDAACEAVRADAMLMLNHTNNINLKHLMEHLVDDVLEPQRTQLATLIREEGIPFPPSPPEISKANELEIPPGAKMTDSMIASRLVADIEGLLVSAHTALLQGLRDDIIAMFYRFHTQVLTQSFTLKKTMEKNGWLRVPPPYTIAHTNPS